MAGFIESWGRGVEKNCSACRNDGLPQLQYTINPGDIMIGFNAPENRVVRVNEKVNDQVRDQKTDNEEKVLELLIEDPGYTITQLSTELGVSKKTISVYLKKLKENKKIVRIGSDRKGYWKIAK